MQRLHFRKPANKGLQTSLEPHRRLKLGKGGTASNAAITLPTLAEMSPRHPSTSLLAAEGVPACTSTSPGGDATFDREIGNLQRRWLAGVGTQHTSTRKRKITMGTTVREARHKTPYVT